MKDHIKYQVKERNRKGLLSWNDLVYGYQLTEDHQGIVVDAKTAPVIKRIFSMYAAGIPAAVIAKALEDEKVLTPKAAKGTKAEVKNPYHWSALTINRLVKKTVYAGYWTKTVHGVSHDYINEPIIDKVLFDKVQRLIEENESKAATRKISGHNRYAGLVCDSQNGFYLHFRKGFPDLVLLVHIAFHQRA